MAEVVSQLILILHISSSLHIHIMVIMEVSQLKSLLWKREYSIQYLYKYYKERYKRVHILYKYIYIAY